MIKIILVAALAIAGVSSQYAPSAESNAAPEPYSYGYETDTHAAAEQRDPSGKVTGYYTLADADGRQRRVEYVADESGFRAKVQTNEVGTKSENSADVEVVASPPNREQLVYTAPAVQQQQTVAVQQGPRVVSQQARYQYVQQPAGYGYGYYPSSGYQYGASYVSQPSYGYSGYGGYGNGVYGGYASNAVYSPYGTGTYTSYNNHLPSQYYRSVGASTTGTQYVQGNTVGKYVTGVPVQSNYRSYQTVGVPATSQGVTYQTVAVPASQAVSYQTVGVQPAQRSASYQGSSNYIVLKKRESDAADEKNKPSKA